MRQISGLAVTAALLAALPAASPSQAESVQVHGVVNIVRSPRTAGRRSDNSNAVVWLTAVNASPARESEDGGESRQRMYRMVQQGKRFEPHLLVVPVGSIVDFPNLDPFFHNVFSLFEGKRFDLGLYEAGTTQSVKFNRSGITYIFCNIHQEMSAVVIVLKTPYFGISNREGEVKISNVPPGRYHIEVFHEQSKLADSSDAPREITISEREPSLGAIRLVESNALFAPHKNKYGYDYTRPEPANPIY